MNEEERTSLERQIAILEQKKEAERQKKRPLEEKMRRCVEKYEKILAEKCPIPWFLWIPFWIPWKLYQNSRFKKAEDEAQSWADKANVHIREIRELDEEIYKLRMKS